MERDGQHAMWPSRAAHQETGYKNEKEKGSHAEKFRSDPVHSAPTR
jgi:hypothetical protein